MARCKYCGCSGWFFTIDAHELCGNCSNILALDVAQRSRIIAESTRLAEQTQNPHSRIARWDLMLKQLEALSKYEERGIQTVAGSPSVMMKDIQLKRDKLILDTARSEMQDILAQVQETPIPQKKIDYYNKILLRMQEYRKIMSNGSPLEEIEKPLKNSVHQIRLSIPLEKARSAELRGKREDALGHYRDALTFLRSNDPERARLSDHIPAIEEKIRALGGTLPS